MIEFHHIVRRAGLKIPEGIREKDFLKLAHFYRDHQRFWDSNWKIILEELRPWVIFKIAKITNFRHRELIEGIIHFCTDTTLSLIYNYGGFEKLVIQEFIKRRRTGQLCRIFEKDPQNKEVIGYLASLRTDFTMLALYLKVFQNKEILDNFVRRAHVSDRLYVLSAARWPDSFYRKLLSIDDLGTVKIYSRHRYETVSKILGNTHKFLGPSRSRS